MTDMSIEHLSAAENEELANVLNELDAIGAEVTQKPLETEEVVGDLEELELLPEVIEEEVVSEDEVTDEVILAVDRAAEKAEAYEAQESIEIVDQTKPTKSKVKRVVSSTPRVARDLNGIEAKYFVFNANPEQMSDEEIGKMKAVSLANMPTQRKVAEKAENVLHSIQAGRPASKYVMTTFALLKEHKVISSQMIVDAFKASGLSDGTARSQQGQMMILLPWLGVAERDGKELKLRDDSNVATFLSGHIAV